MAGDSQITEQLGPVKRKNFRNSLEFDDQSPSYQQVETQVRPKQYAVVLHWNHDFAFVFYPGLVQLDL